MATSFSKVMMHGTIPGQDRHRYWCTEEKPEIVLLIGVGGRTATQIAQRQDASRTQIYSWRNRLKKKGLLSALAEALLLPA